MNRRRIVLVASALGLVLMALAAICGITGYKYWNDRKAEDARTQVVPAAQRTVEAMFTYNFKTVDAELPKAADNLTGGFRDDYLKLIKEAIAPGAKEKELNVQATTQASGVVSAEPAHAVVLLYLNQVSTGKDSPQASISTSRVKVSLDKNDGHWLVSAVTPI
ncbi:h domain protein [Nocardia sp. NBC_00565]|uniref:h domain protein n=1 Tax=Nocardia sp. NBC_00565 TaxID=2975993 RepID=UPI002E8209CA|nr:h domain protein [Nocardia sp. NBC_00565]WUC02524.1 h domain protein [Nocardia sp. NBC_00565]